jgi:hypothetical protein
MSKAAAIHTAICLQMAEDGKQALDPRGHLGDAPPGANQDPRYTAATIRAFLAKVAIRLRADTPSLIFDWSKVPHAECLTDELWMVEDTIGKATSEAGQAQAKEPAAQT